MRTLLRVVLIVSVLLCAWSSTVAAQEWTVSSEPVEDELRIFGTAPPGTRIVVILGQKHYGGEATADEEGVWELTMPPPGERAVSLMRTDTRAIVPLIEGEDVVATDSKPIEFEIETPSPIEWGDVVRGRAGPERTIVVRANPGGKVAAVRPGEDGWWQVLLEGPHGETAREVVIESLDAQRRVVDTATLQLSARPAPIRIDTPTRVLQPQYVRFQTAPNSQMRVVVGQQSYRIQSSSSGFAGVNLSGFEPGSYVLKATVAPGSNRESVETVAIEILNTEEAPVMDQALGYLGAGLIGGALLGGVAYLATGSLALDREDAPDDPAAVLTPIGFAAGMALAGPVGLHLATKPSKFYGSLTSAFAASLAFTFIAQYVTLPLQDGRAAWGLTLGTSLVAIPALTVMAYDLGPLNRRGVQGRMVRWYAAPTGNGLALGGSW